MSTTLIRCERRIWSDDIAVYYGVRDSYGNTHVALPATMQRREPGDAVAEPLLSLSRDAAQRLMDELWNTGLRPSEGTGSAGSLAATERHLKDMQTIAMGLLKGEF